MSKFSRRDFLKLAALLPPAIALSNIFPTPDAPNSTPSQTLPNVIILLFDAMTARNLSVYGYRRKTTTNFDRFAKHATVYHAHNAAGNFTTPGTSSLLTGMYPWTHRAINLTGLVERDLTDRNIFRLVGKEYKRIAFAQNLLANIILAQFRGDIDHILPLASFGITDHILGDKFADRNFAYSALDDFLFKHDLPASMIFNPIEQVLFSKVEAQNLSNDYPKGLPGTVNYPVRYRLDDLFTGLGDFVRHLDSPYFAYFHMFSPHAPYRPSKEFYGKFEDNWRPAAKPVHRFSDNRPNSELNDGRRGYDEYVGTVDQEFGRLYDTFDQLGIWKNSYVIITADHGEMFERGEKYHNTPLLFDPVVHIPLMISAPGQQDRKDIYSLTNSVDVLPTLLHLTGREIPAWCQGTVLPGMGGKEDPQRATFSVEAKNNHAFAPIKKGTIAMRKGGYKLIYYTGYEDQDSFELYDLENDLEELTDLYPKQPAFAAALREELLTSLHAADIKPKS